MADQPMDEESRRERLSALLDGECGALDAQEACGVWREDAELRATWHAYHLIGDVLRSEDLAHPVGRDADLLAALRDRLAREPVVLAPAPPVEKAARRRRPHGWVAPLAVAAGFVVVGGVLVVMRIGAPDAGDRSAVVATSPGPARPVVAPAADADVQALVADGKLIRDARLDRYLAAHKQFGDSSAVAVPGLVLRSSAAVAPAR
jgi:sigma-E factor negative regulatory protein RseA